MLAIRFKSDNYNFLLQRAKERNQSVPPYVVKLTTVLQLYKEGQITQSAFLKAIDGL